MVRAKAVRCGRRSASCTEYEPAPRPLSLPLTRKFARRKQMYGLTTRGCQSPLTRRFPEEDSSSVRKTPACSLYEPTGEKTPQVRDVTVDRDQSPGLPAAGPEENVT